MRNNKKKTLFFTSIASLLAYDYAVRDLEYVGGLSRFLRSLKIAVQISYDYTASLWGVEEDSDEYNEVRIEHFFCVTMMNISDNESIASFSPSSSSKFISVVQIFWSKVAYSMVDFTSKRVKALRQSITFFQLNTPTR